MAKEQETPSLPLLTPPSRAPPETFHLFGGKRCQLNRNPKARKSLKKPGKTLHIPANKTLAEVMLTNGFFVKQKCIDGLCGTCSMEYLKGDVEHRDFVLVKIDRETNIITCCSRAEPNGETIVLDV